MKNKRGIWLIVIIIIALFAIAIWLLTSPTIDNQVDINSQDNVEGVIID